MATFESSLKPRLIYVFAIADARHEGSLKIGETTLNDDVGSASTEPNSEVLTKQPKLVSTSIPKLQVSVTNCYTPS